MGARDYLISPVLNLRDFDNAYLRFDYAYAQRYMQKDSLIISISADCGDSWARIYANGPDGNGIFETAEPNNSYFEPAFDDDWCGQGYGADCPMLDLSEWAGLSNLRIRLESYNNYGNNLYIKNLTISNITDLKDWQTSKSLLVFPNPASDYVVVQHASESGQALIKLSDLNGKVIYEKLTSDKAHVISTKMLPNGSYLLTVTSDGQTAQRKLIITK